MTTVIFELLRWLHPLVYVVGFCVAVWAFQKCRKRGYIVIAAFFALAVYSLVAAPFVNRVIETHRKPDISMETRKKLNDAIHETTRKVLAEAGNPLIAAAPRNVDFPLGSVLLVTGLWLLAMKE